MHAYIGKAVVGIGIVVAMGIGVVGCHGGTTTHHPARPAATAYPLCTALVGMPTQIAKDQLCDQTGDGDLLAAGTAVQVGSKGTVYWNDTGWGLADGTWQAFNRSDGQLIPPDEYLN